MDKEPFIVIFLTLLKEGLVEKEAIPADIKDEVILRFENNETV